MATNTHDDDEDDNADDDQVDAHGDELDDYHKRHNDDDHVRGTYDSDEKNLSLIMMFIIVRRSYDALMQMTVMQQNDGTETCFSSESLSQHGRQK